MNLISYTTFRSNKFYKLLLLSIAVLSVNIFLNSSANAQLDASFGVNGVTQTNVAGNDSPLGTFVLPDQKILVLVANRTNNQPADYYFARYNSDGTLDAAYGTNGIKQLSVPTFSSGTVISGALRQPDGKFILFGGDSGSGFISRFNEDGTIDQSFGTNGIHLPNIDFNAGDVIYDGAVLPDGKILAVGTSATNTGGVSLFFIRYSANGILDKTFNNQGFIVNPVPQLPIKKMFLQSTGKIVIYSEGAGSSVAERYNSDGTIDNTFTNIPNSVSDSSEKSLLILPDDSIIVATSFEKIGTLGRIGLDIKVSKYTPDGIADGSFGVGGAMSFDLTTGFNDRVFAIAAQADGQLIIGTTVFVEPNRSRLEGSMLYLARVSSGGMLSGKFLLTGSVVLGKGALNILPSGKILTTFVNNDETSANDLLLTRSLGVPLETRNFKGVPFDFRRPNTNLFEIDGISDPTVYRVTEQKWYVYPYAPEFGEFIFGHEGDIPVPADYLGNLRSELAVFRTSNGTWFLATSFYNSGQSYFAVQWGMNGDIPVPADFDNDSKSDLAVFRPSDGTWLIRNSSDSSPRIQHWGSTGDKPAVGDYDGDGEADVAVFRPSDGVWYILKSFDDQPSFIRFGLNGDIPVQEDYDGDGKTDIAVWRPSTRVWYVLRSSDGGFSAVEWGLSDDYPVPADYDGDKKIDIAVWRPSQGRWYVLRSSDTTLGIFYWGISTDIIPLRRE